MALAASEEAEDAEEEEDEVSSGGGEGLYGEELGLGIPISSFLIKVKSLGTPPGLLRYAI